MIRWEIETLRPEHDRFSFSCGVPALDAFIQKHVNQYEKRNLGRTYVAVSVGNQQVCGYYTLVAGSIPFDSLPENLSKKLPRHPVPSMLLARLAVDTRCQTQRLGSALLRDALRRSALLADQAGVYAVYVQATTPEVVPFYRKYGFVELKDQPQHLILPLSSLKQVETAGRTG